MELMIFFFFFSSRRRHTRWPRDWSSDVCSSDLGLGKANEVSDAIQKGFDNARKNLIKIPLTKTGSIHHPVVGKAGAGEVLLRPASDGTGVIAGGAVKAILDVAGVQNILSKSLGTSNPHNMVKAAYEALKQLTDPLEVAQRRGVSVKKVFEG